MSEIPEDRPLLEVRDLVVEYRRRAATFRAVQNVSFTIRPGETLGLVGESGSGKTSIARAVQGLLTQADGSIEFDGKAITSRRLSGRRALAANIQTVFQDPFGSMNPARSVGSIVEEPLRVQSPAMSRAEVRQAVIQELERVGLPADAAGRRPRAFSGGQRQRIAIARALIARPRLVICDEAVSALDLSIQAQILNLLISLQQERGISYLFITHDLAVVQHIASRIAVLEQGRIVDLFDARNYEPADWSAYTRKLFDAAPVPDPALQREKRRQFEALAKQLTA
jgi:peptide/nickel transport system ATP-binding protein